MSNKVTEYINNSYKEMKKVVWPTKQEVVQHTAMVILFSLAVAAFLGGVDYVLNLIVSQII